MRREKTDSKAATLGEVWEGMKRLPRDILVTALMPSTWLCFLFMTVFLSLYVLVPALLLDYLPARLFGYTKGTGRLDGALGLLLATMAGLYLWGKYVRPRRERAERLRRYQRLRAELGPIRERLAEVVMRRGKNHPETGYAYRELGEKYRELGQLKQARRVHREESGIFRETLGESHPEVRFWGKQMEEPEPLRVVQVPTGAGDRSQDVGDLFDGRTTLLALGVILAGNVAMTAVIVGLAYALEAIFSLL